MFRDVDTLFHERLLETMQIKRKKEEVMSKKIILHIFTILKNKIIQNDKLGTRYENISHFTVSANDDNKKRNNISLFC